MGSNACRPWRYRGLKEAVFNIFKQDHPSYTCILQLSAVLHLQGVDFHLKAKEKLCTTASRMLGVGCNE